MSECRSEYQKLPPGWDCKVDKTTGKCYYINYLTKAMQIEDPRNRYKQLQNEKCSTESIPLQPLHGSPYHVYPASNYPAVKAFQGPNTSSHNVSASPLLSAKMQTQMEMVSTVRPASPQTPLMGTLPRRQTIQETSFTNNIDTDTVVAKINNMFPTASENHIRLLLKKYYNREAVVISALQVEKHPVTMPGPFATPPAQRHLFHSNSSVFQMTPPARRLESMISRTGSPAPGRPGSVASGLYGSPRFSPKPHSSPKMKLRYLKTIFPKADEMFLLDVLANSDNNVQKASEKLISMGYTKRDVMGAPKLSNRTIENKQTETVESSDEKIISLHPKVLTTEDKESIKKTLQNQYKTIAERIILMALESVNYSEDRASQILQIVLQEDETKEKQKKKKSTEKATSSVEVTVKEGPEVISESKSASRVIEEPQVTSSTLKCTSSNQSTSSPSSSAVQSAVDGPVCEVPPQSAIIDYNYTSVPIPIYDAICVSAAYIEPVTVQHSSSSSNPSSSLSPSPLTSDSSIGHNEDAKKSRSKAKSDFTKSTPKTISNEESPTITKFQSVLKRVATNGANPDLCKGPNEGLLLADYVTWSGANPDISLGNKGIARGSDSKLRRERSNSLARGHNSELCKGPQVSLAKGSIYSQLNRPIVANVRCN